VFPKPRLGNAVPLVSTQKGCQYLAVSFKELLNRLLFIRLLDTALEANQVVFTNSGVDPKR
jgi:hypothetical protein